MSEDVFVFVKGGYLAQKPAVIVSVASTYLQSTVNVKKDILT